MRPRDGRADRLSTSCAGIYFGEAGGPGPAPARPDARSAHVLDEFRARIAPHTLNSYHPRALSATSRRRRSSPRSSGELLAQWTNQGVDVWHAGPVGAFVEEEVVRWLCDLVGYGEGSFGLLTSGGVMANFIAMALVRDVHLRRARRRVDRPPRGAALEGVRVYTCDQTHFSIARALDELGFPPETLVVAPGRRPLPPPRGARRRGDRPRPGGRPPSRRRSRAVAGSTNTGSVDLDRASWPTLAAREGLWFHVDAAYGGAARLSARDAGRVPGLDLADSVTVDPHKWFFQAYDIGGLLVRDGAPPAPDVRPLARVLPRRRGAAAGERRRRRTRTPTRASSTSTSSASRARGAGGRSSCG